MATGTVRERKPADDTVSGLGAWEERELPEPPRPKALQWIGVVGPGVIVLGASIGSGDFLLGPAAFVQYGLSILWITGLATRGRHRWWRRLVGDGEDWLWRNGQEAAA